MRGTLKLPAWARGAIGACGLLLCAHSTAQDGVVLAVVVPVQAPVEALGLAEVVQIYRRKKTLWEGGARIVPVNLPADHPLRRRFSRVVLRQSPEQQAEYWNQQYFQGVLPPHVLASEQAVLRFLIETPNAVGYLPYCGLSEGLRAVLRIDDTGRVLTADERVECAAAR